MSEQRPNKTLDCTGMLCPMPVVKTNKTIRGMAVGEILEMTATDPGSMPDMQAWARQTQHELLLAEEAKAGLFRFVIRKTH